MALHVLKNMRQPNHAKNIAANVELLQRRAGCQDITQTRATAVVQKTVFKHEGAKAVEAKQQLVHDFSAVEADEVVAERQGLQAGIVSARWQKCSTIGKVRLSCARFGHIIAAMLL